MTKRQKRIQALIESFLKTIRGLVKPIGPDSAAFEDGLPLSDNQVNEWRQGMTNAIMQHHYAAALAGAEGRPLTPTEQAQVKAIVVTQVQYLDQFAATVVDDEEFDRTSAARANMYATAVRSSYETAAAGFLPLPAMPAEGTICMSNCKCLWRVETIDAEAGDYDAYWERHAEDSCQTCIARERMWSPVAIRGGVLL
jgi:hypothetical protein